MSWLLHHADRFVKVVPVYFADGYAMLARVNKSVIKRVYCKQINDVTFVNPDKRRDMVVAQKTAQVLRQRILFVRSDYHEVTSCSSNIEDIFNKYPVMFPILSDEDEQFVHDTTVCVR